MGDRPSEEAKFTDQQVREILKRAVEEDISPTMVRGEGLSLTELKDIGTEVGIDPFRLENAARAVLREGQKGPNPIVGAHTVLNFERRVQGEVDSDSTPEILSIIRRNMGPSGEISEIHGFLEWSSKGDFGERHIGLTSQHGVTSITASANLTNAAIQTYVPAGMIGLICSILGMVQAADADLLVGMIFFFSLIPALYLVLRTIYGRISKSVEAKLEKVVDELAQLADGSLAP